MPTNLWPDFDIGKTPRSPKTVIEEVGSGLRSQDKRSGSILYGRPIVKDNNVEVPFSLYARSLRYKFPFLASQICN